MRRLDYIVFSGEDGWHVSANGIDCGIVSDRDGAVMTAVRWAHRNEERGHAGRVLTMDGETARIEWESGQPFPSLRLMARLMRGPSSAFVRELADWRPLYMVR